MEKLMADKHMERHTLLVIRERKQEPKWALVYHIILYHIILPGLICHVEPSFHLASSMSGSKMSAPAGGNEGRPEEVKSHPFRQDQEAVTITSIRSPPTRTSLYLVARDAGKCALCRHFLNHSYSSIGEKNVIGAKPEVSTSTENYIQCPMINHKSFPGESDGKESDRTLLGKTSRFSSIAHNSQELETTPNVHQQMSG